MKTLRHLSPTAAPLAVAVSLVLLAGELSAAGPAGGAVVGGANGTNGASTGTASAGVSGAGPAGASRGGISSGATISGARPGVGFSNNAGGMRGMTGRGIGTSPVMSAPYHNSYNAGGLSRTATATAPAASRPAASRPANAWSGLAVNQTNNAGVNRGAARSANHYNNWTADGYTGQRLDPSAPGANLPTYNQGNRGYRNGNYGSRFGSQYYYYPYAYGPYYAPYINYFGGYYAGAYPYYNDVPAADTQFGAGANTVSPQYVEQAPANTDNQQPDANQQTPAPQRQQAPPDANGGTIPNNGPDSLVEAVQEELVRRGYFAGKVDAMYNPETREALRKFQTDHHLAATGLINEATLHALQLD